MEIGVISRMALPHFPEDLQPALAEAAQSACVALAALTDLVVVDGGPRTRVPAEVGPQMNDVPQGLVAVAPNKHFVDLAGLVTDGGSPGQALEAAWILKARAIRTDLPQQPRGELRPR